MNDLEIAFATKLLELYPELKAVRNTYVRRTGVDCEFHYNLDVSNHAYIVYIEFWDDGTIWYAIEDEDHDVYTPNPRYSIADPNFTIEEFANHLKAQVSIDATKSRAIPTVGE